MASASSSHRGSIHYARVPRELWRDRLLKLKRAGFNTVQTYVFWNFQETKQGQIDFTTGARDFGAFLQAAQDVGLYATVRVGPYVCAEWDSGGFPVWLRFLPGLKVRCDNPPFLDAVDKFFDKLLPIVAAHQINHGGNVILVQLENEDPQGWGTEMPNSYFTHLQKKALDLGIEVPYFFSGLHHGTNPADYGPWDSAGRKNPWFSTETWVRWYDAYGNSPPRAACFLYTQRMEHHCQWRQRLQPVHGPRRDQFRLLERRRQRLELRLRHADRRGG